MCNIVAQCLAKKGAVQLVNYKYTNMYKYIRTYIYKYYIIYKYLYARKFQHLRAQLTSPLFWVCRRHFTGPEMRK